MNKFYTVITKLGEQLIANAVASQLPLKLTHMAVGDGNGKLPAPSIEQKSLINEVHRGAINTLTVDEKNKNHLIAELIIPEVKGGYWIREVGLYDEKGNLIAVGNLPETYKPKMTEGSGKTQAIRMIILLSHTNCVELNIDPNVVIATRSYVDDVIESHAKSRNHPDATTTAKGFVKLNSAITSSSETEAATPLAVKNINDSTLKLTGGTLTGNLQIKGTNQNISFENQAGDNCAWTFNSYGSTTLAVGNKTTQKHILAWTKSSDDFAIGNVKRMLINAPLMVNYEYPQIQFESNIGKHTLISDKKTVGYFRFYFSDGEGNEGTRLRWTPSDKSWQFEQCNQVRFASAPIWSNSAIETTAAMVAKRHEIRSFEGGITSIPTSPNTQPNYGTLGADIFRDKRWAVLSGEDAAKLGHTSNLTFASWYGIGFAPLHGAGTPLNNTVVIDTRRGTVNALNGYLDNGERVYSPRNPPPSAACVGEYREFMHRANELPHGWYALNGQLFFTTTPQGKVLASLSDNFKRDWNIVIENGTINMPTMFTDKGVGYFTRPVNSVNRNPGSVQWSDNLKHYHWQNSEATNSTHVDITSTNVPVKVSPQSAYLGYNIRSTNGPATLGMTSYSGGEESRPINRGMTPAMYLGV